ncbi:MAG: aspartate/glutamate racemase family protein, partial [Zestosphaera sp.]
SEVLPTTLREMADESVKAAEDLATAEVDVIVYGCTTGSLLEGVGWELSLRERIERASRVKTITAAEAVVKALKSLDVKRVVIATPYVEELNVRERKFLEDNGFEVPKVEGLGLVKNAEIGRQPPWVAYRLALKAIEGVSVDGIFISCTNFRTLEVVNALEDRAGLPVVTSNTASFWLAMRSIGIREGMGYGKLLKEVKNASP